MNDLSCQEILFKIIKKKDYFWKLVSFWKMRVTAAKP